jgi:hypothetical protein
VCTNIATKTRITGSAKSGDGWARVDEATIGYDHATHLWLEHTLRLDLWSADAPTSPRASIELDLASARELLRRLEEVIREAEGASLS